MLRFAAAFFAIAMIFLAAGLRPAAAQTAQAASEATGPVITIPEGVTGQAAIAAYLGGVRAIFVETARMLGAARGPDRAALITLQNYCSRSMGRLRGMLNEAEVKPVTDPVGVANQSRALYDECRTRYDGHRAG